MLPGWNSTGRRRVSVVCWVEDGKRSTARGTDLSLHFALHRRDTVAGDLWLIEVEHGNWLHPEEEEKRPNSKRWRHRVHACDRRRGPSSAARPLVRPRGPNDLAGGP